MRAVASTSATSRWRRSRDGVACSSASRPVSASCGWTAGSVVQRRNRRRCSVTARARRRKPHGRPARSPAAGLASTRRLALAQRKNDRRVVSRRARLAGRRARNASRSAAWTVAQSVLPARRRGAGQVADDGQVAGEGVIGAGRGRPAGPAAGRWSGRRRNGPRQAQRLGGSRRPGAGGVRPRGGRHGLRGTRARRR